MTKQDFEMLTTLIVDHDLSVAVHDDILRHCIKRNDRFDAAQWYKRLNQKLKAKKEAING